MNIDKLLFTLIGAGNCKLHCICNMLQTINQFKLFWDKLYFPIGHGKYGKGAEFHLFNLIFAKEELGLDDRKT